MELSKIEERAVMLETQTPAYARTDEIRRAIDDMHRHAMKLTAITGMKHAVSALVPMHHKYVSGLNVPSNWEITVAAGPKAKNSFWRTMSDYQSRSSKARKALEARNVS